ncbi:LysR family transcriptional regulator [Pectobacterium carotovorum subsp. carotovorum]|uniref:LysR family transcriptional regulator n=1 Tax=Pectobacterium versatile TaxID=2488639 RepID=UPI00202DAA87|nr:MULTISPECIES: LysR family transcriptional regulator [Pectobacterium]MCL6334100.1 LysR family transcriptional regulator [Pectobacterium carotovorum subsp. carotovorum]MCL6347373.1 LysR family transcriptional regulator [Pectobacterium carotovorum subsp. carotovorum]MCL6364469.1 LysR family transcriptional regulator [Pectobacterium carotovorum subsp. carotovorum]MCL6402059.1 LysR family transcriptional regulator [Pectobacterium carotovorum subsp. carotovorum]MCO4313948.1 LysR family transcript
MFKQLQDMALFALVAECGSFTQAARKAGLAKSSLSLRISQLEQQIGLRLLNRTTRQLNLTFAGERYLIHCQEMLQASERADLAVQRLRDNPSGRLRITSPAGLGSTLLARLTAEFQQRFPAVSLDVLISDDVIDLVQEGFDVAFRTGKPHDSSLIGRSLGQTPRYLLASPDYLARHSALLHPQQLQQHRCIAHHAWTEWFLHRGSELYRWLLPDSHITDNLLYARECAIAGAGITLLPDFLCLDEAVSGKLVKVLPDWKVEANELYLVYPSRKLNSPALACFIDFVLQHRALDDYSAFLKKQ